jgi:sugar lactone lactonase YvrE
MTIKARFAGYSEPEVYGDWSFERLTRPSRLHGANGVRTGADGRVYIAQVAGSQVSAIDVDSGDIEIISRMGSDIVAPDDLVFDDKGNMFLTEITEDRVSMLMPNGITRVIQGGMICANPITMYQGRLIAGECRPGGRIMELDLNGGAPRMILDNVPMPNAFEVGPDGKLYMPIMGMNEIWRVDLSGGPHEVVARDLGVPDSVKFDAQGNIISTQVASGQVLKIDPRSGAKSVLAQLAPGLDNCTFVGDRIFVSSINGSLTEVSANGDVKPVVKQGLQWPLGIACDTSGEIFVADGAFTYLLRDGEELRQAGFLFFPGYPGYTRGVVSDGNGAWLVTTSNGQLARTWPAEMRSEELCNGFDRLMGVAIDASGNALFAEYGTGKIHGWNGSSVETIADGLKGPTGIVVDSEGAIYVSEQDAGKISIIRGGRVDTFAENFIKPHDLCIANDTLYVVDAGSHAVVSIDLNSGARQLIASSLPIGAPPGVEPKILGAIGDMAGPMLSFTGITAGSDDVLYLAGDAEGSVIKLSQR